MKQLDSFVFMERNGASNWWTSKSSQEDLSRIRPFNSQQPSDSSMEAMELLYGEDEEEET